PYLYNSTQKSLYEQKAIKQLIASA
ncbi:hypothetical protein P3TCK_22844, partial [Photobacterium profundum 3TCK]